jgi:arylsulfatase A-like enzyme
MIIVTSDHGESFGNHDIMTHGFSLYEEELKVPLLIKYPSSQPLKGIMADPVSLVDVLPTILSTLGLVSPEGVQGKTLPAQGRPIIAESYNNWRKILLYGNRFNRDLRVIFDGPFKYIWGSNGCELYDIEHDPHEQNNIIEEMPDKARNMQAMLDEWLNSFTPVLSREFTPIDKATEESLRALGYLP